MSQNVLPELDAAAGLVPKPGSVTWRYAGDARLMAASGYALVLQVGLPTVANGVREHSNYAEDPYGRLLRTLDYVNLTVYGGPEAAWRTGRMLREMHKRIKGVAPDGTRYHALEPDAFAWVHATLIDAIVAGHRLFGRRLSPPDVEQMYAEWRQLGRIAGVRERDLPDSWGGFCQYRDAMIEERLEHSDVIDGVLETLTKPAAPPLPFMSDPAWRAARLPIARAFRLATVGLLPESLRQRFGLRFTRAQEAELRAIGAVSRASFPVLPKNIRCMGPAYLRWRQDAIGRGEMADAAAAIPAAA